MGCRYETEPSTIERVRGLLLGFAVGDALGAPAAGLPGPSFVRRFGPIRGFISNPHHPYLGHLAPGSFTENTRLLLDAARDYASLGTFDETLRRRTLLSWADRVSSDGVYSRWPGRTTLEGALRLRDQTNKSPPEGRDSVGATYRCLPIAVVTEWPYLCDIVRDEVRLTHVHPDSTTCATLVALIARMILLGAPIVESFKRSLNAVEERLGPSTLLGACKRAIDDKRPMTALQRAVGTGARCSETLPLSLAILARLSSSLDDAMICGANAFKWDYNGRWDQKTADRNGGNTDGIAAIVGALAGAHYGGHAVAASWGDVEAVDWILATADTLYESYVSS